MMTVKEVSRLTGVSVRTLQYYDKIGLLPPAEYTEVGYRLYDDTALQRLQQILLFRELDFSLKEIKTIIENPNFNKNEALEQQITLLKMKKEHLENLITFACGLKQLGVNSMEFSAFDKKKQEEYAKQAKEKWQNTEAYNEFSEKSKNRSAQAEDALGKGLMLIFEDLGKLKSLPLESPEVQDGIKRLQSYISENYYQCTTPILLSLGLMYSESEEFRQNIDSAGGEGTAQFVSKAIGVYCEK